MKFCILFLFLLIFSQSFALAGDYNQDIPGCLKFVPEHGFSWYNSPTSGCYCFTSQLPLGWTYVDPCGYYITNPIPTPTATPTSTPTPINKNIWEQSEQCYLLHPVQDYGTSNSFLNAANMVVSILPQSPQNMRLPTIFANFTGGSNTLGSNLAIEIYSAVWQFYLLIAMIKLYKLIPGKGT